MPDVLRVIILEDRPDDAELVIDELERDGHQVLARIVDNRRDFQAALTPDIDVILADLLGDNRATQGWFRIFHLFPDGLFEMGEGLAPKGDGRSS